MFALVVTGCNNPAALKSQNQLVEAQNLINELTARVDNLEAEVNMLTAEVLPKFVGSSAATTFNIAPFLRRHLEREFAGNPQLPKSFWEERLNQARLDLMGGRPTYDDVLAEKEFYEAWRDYAKMLRRNSDGFTRGNWQVGDEHLSRLDYLQLQLKWLSER